MRCKHCRAHQSKQTDLPLKTFKEVLKFAMEEKSNDFHTTLSGGEPFLNPNLISFIDEIENVGVDNFSITTNGSIHNRTVIERLKKSNFKTYFIQISLDSINPAKHNQFRGFDGAWEKATKLMDTLKKENITYAIRSTITPNNFFEINDLCKLAEEKGAVRLSLDPVIPAGRGTDKSLWLAPKQKKLFLEKLISLKKEKEGIIEILSECPQKLCIPNSPYLIEKVDLESKATFGGCSAGITQISLENDGTITPCALFPKTIIDATNKTTTQIRDAYEKSQLLKELVERKFSGKCGTCKYNRLCGGCRANALYNGNYLGSDSSCWMGAKAQ